MEQEIAQQLATNAPLAQTAAGSLAAAAGMIAIGQYFGLVPRPKDIADLELRISEKYATKADVEKAVDRLTDCMNRVDDKMNQLLAIMTSNNER